MDESVAEGTRQVRFRLPLWKVYDMSIEEACIKDVCKVPLRKTA